MGKYQNSLFKKLDIFGVPPLFTIRGSSTFRTNTGSSLTIICCVLIIIYFYFFLNQMINHKSPNLHSSILYDITPPEIKLHRNNFTFIFGLQNKEYINYIDESIYKVKAFQNKLTLKNDGNYNYENFPLKIMKCNEYNIQIIPENFNKLPLNNLYCIDNNLNLKGEYMKENWNFIQVNFSKCENSTENKCKSEEEINKLLIGGYIGIFIPDYSFDPSNYLKPYKPYVKNLNGGFSIKYFEDIFLYFKLIEVITDSGYFFEKKKSINFVSYDYIQKDIDFRESNNFLSLSIRVSSKREIYKRSYIKLQTIFSNVGGMLKIILLIGEYSVYFIRMTLYKNYILEFFNLDESEIRLKEIRKIYRLNGLNSTKIKIESFFPNINNTENTNQLSANAYLKVTHSHKNLIKIMSPEEGINDNQDENFVNKKNSINQIKTIKLDNDLKKNNFLKIGFIKERVKTQKTLISKNISHSKILKNVNLFENKDNKNDTAVSNGSGLIEKKKSHCSQTSLINKRNLMKNQIIIPKTQLRVIKVPGFFTDFVCKKNTFKTIKQVHENYKEIQFLLDIVHYLKLENEVNIIEKYLFNDQQRKVLSYTYTFEADFGLERKGYEYMIKHKKNKFDEKELNEASHKNLLSLINKSDI